MYIVVSNTKFACNMGMLNIHTFRLSLLFGGLDPMGIFLSTRFGRKLLLISYKETTLVRARTSFLLQMGNQFFVSQKSRFPDFLAVMTCH